MAQQSPPPPYGVPPQRNRGPLSAIPGGKLQITGSYNKADAEKLAGQITG